VSVFKKIIAGVCMLWAVTGGAVAQTSSQPAAKPSASAGGGTIYFLRPMPLMGWANKPDVRLDGRLVGEISPGTYFVVKVPRGVHKIVVQGGLAGPFESELQVEAGKSYFIEVGAKDEYAPIGQKLVGRIVSNQTWTGQPMAGSGFFAAYGFYLLNEQEGRARIAQLKKIGR
jgi:hypothetical protein